jgi:23S rRNA U2552 (ribose-2'-O)-methylase RlmE/FtsJ
VAGTQGLVWNNGVGRSTLSRLKKRRKNETSTHVPSDGYSHVPCLRIFLDEIRFYARCAMALEIIRSLLKETANDITKEKTKTRY